VAALGPLKKLKWAADTRGMRSRLLLGALTAALVTPAAAAAGAPLHRCAHAPSEGRLSVSVDPGPGCDGAAILARKIHATASRRFPHKVPKHYTVDAPSPADASPATFRFRCAVHNEVTIDRRGDQFRITSARCANQRGSRFRYSFTMA
jgi:hypothetical protein